MTNSRTALVIGGGVAGPVAAMALQKAGFDATVFEAYPSGPSARTGSTAGTCGALLSLAPNGLAALDVIGAAEGPRSIGQPITEMVLTDGPGRRMGVLPGLSGLEPARALGREELQRYLQDEARARGIRVETGRRLRAVVETATGVTARFDDGSSADGDLLVGADGIHSTVRRLIDPGAAAPGHVPLLNFGALADLAVPAGPTTMYFSFGRRGFLGYWAQPDGRTAWFSNLPHAEPMTTAQARRRSNADWLDVLAGVYADDRPGAALVRATRAEDLVVLGSTQILRTVPRWHRGRMVLVGDSVHAPSPSSGQGASLAIESAVELARCLRDLPDQDDQDAGLQAAFARYERLRRARVEKVATRAARTNNTKALGPAAIVMMRMVMPLATRTLLTPERTLGAEQRYRIEWGAPVPAA